MTDKDTFNLCSNGSMVLKTSRKRPHCKVKGRINYSECVLCSYFKAHTPDTQGKDDMKLTDEMIEEAANDFKDHSARSAFIEGAVFARESLENEMKSLRKYKRKYDELRLEKSWTDYPECMGK